MRVGVSGIPRNVEEIAVVDELAEMIEVYAEFDQRPAKSRSPNGEWSSTLPSPRPSAQLIRATRCDRGALEP